MRPHSPHDHGGCAAVGSVSPVAVDAVAVDAVEVDAWRGGRVHPDAVVARLVDVRGVTDRWSA